MATKKTATKAKAKKTETSKKEEKVVKKNTKKATPKTKKKVEAAPKKIETKKTEPVTDQFVSFCGSHYAPDKSGECEMTCKQEYNEEYVKCLEHFKAQAKAPEAKTKKSSKKNKRVDWLGNGLGTRAAGMNELLREGATVEEMTKHFNSTDSATRSHLHTLKAKKGLDIFKIPGSNVMIFDDPEIMAENTPIGCFDNPKHSGKDVKTPDNYKPSEDVMRLFQ